MLSTNLALVDTTGSVDSATMAAVAAALNIQVTRDLPQFWSVSANVSYLPDPNSIPQGTWPIQLVDSLPDGEGGFHLTDNKQPYAKVVLTPGSDAWSIDASHEAIEMLVDPFGSRLQTSIAIQIAADNTIQDGDGKFEYLVEACDPCEADACGYSINGILVSDFITPNFYDLSATPGTRYSFTGAVTRPREIVQGGYISWVDPNTNEMWQILWLDPAPELKDLGPATEEASLRVFVEKKTYRRVSKSRQGPTQAVADSRMKYRASLATAAHARAKLYK